MNTTKFMGWLTVLLLAGVMLASTWMFARDQIPARDYLNLWTPLLTLAVGYWFGKGGPAT